MTASSAWHWDRSGDRHVLTVTLPIQLVSEANSRGHWAKGARRAKQQRGLVKMVLSAALGGAGVSAPIEVTITRIAPRALDDDNNIRAGKACRDGIADALGIDDRDPRVTWRYGQERAAPKTYAVRIVISRGGELAHAS